MRTKEAYLEVVDYRIPEIENTSNVFIKNFAYYSGIIGTKEWVAGMFRLRDIIENKKPSKQVFRAEGLELIFSGFPNPIPTIKEERLVYSPREPRFTIFETVKEDGLLPSKRNRIEEVIDEISEEMKSVYRLRVEKNPQTLIFPTEEYAKPVTVYNAYLIQSF